MKKIISAIIIICIIIIGFIAYKSMAKPTVKANAATLMNNSNSSNTQKTDTSTGDTSASSTNSNSGNNSSTNTTTTNAQSQSANSSNIGSEQNSGSNNQGTDTSSSTSTTTTNSNTPATNTQKLIPSKIEYLNLAVPFGDPTHLLTAPNTNATLIPTTALSGVVKVKILGLTLDKNYFYVDYNGVKGFITSSLLSGLANNYQENLNTANVSKPNPTDTFKYTIRIPNNVVINAYKTPEMNTAPILQLENTDRGTCTFLFDNFAANNSAKIFYKNQTLYVNRNYLMDYCLQPLKMSDFTN